MREKETRNKEDLPSDVKSIQPLAQFAQRSFPIIPIHK